MTCAIHPGMNQHPVTTVTTIKRSDLVARKACPNWLKVFDEICTMRGDDKAPMVRRGGVSRRDPQRLRVALSPLAQLWLARDAVGAVTWLRAEGLLPNVFLPGANLEGANLEKTSLEGANLYRANL